MSGLWVIYVLVFGAALFGVQALYWTVSGAVQQQKTINRRLALNRQMANAADVLDALRHERGFANFNNPVLARLGEFLVQTGVKAEPNRLGLYVLGLGVVLLVLLSLAFGFTLLTLVLAAIMSPALTFLYLSRVRRRRIAVFAEQFPAALEIIVRGVKVGHPFSTALGLVAKEMPDPIGTEFGMTSDEIAFGLEVNAAVDNLHRRVGQEDLLFFITAINVQSRTGGNLAEVLDRLSQLIRQRAKTRLKIKALTAEGRLSAIFLSLIPFAIFGGVMVVAPSYYSEVQDHPITIPALSVALVLLVIGNVVIRRMVNFKV